MVLQRCLCGNYRSSGTVDSTGDQPVDEFDHYYGDWHDKYRIANYSHGDAQFCIGQFGEIAYVVRLYDDPSRNITITDCTFENGHGLSIGSEIAGGVQNVHAERIHFKGTDQGIRIKAARDRGNDVSNISFKDITMEDVKTAILITEYYPHPAPDGEVAAEPVQRLTPKFHGITIENVTATNSGSDGLIVGLPESPVTDLTMSNVHLSGKTGMSIAYANVTMHDVTVKAENGEPMKIAPTAKVTGYKP